MWLVLCTPEDDSALWLYRRLRALERTPVRLVDQASLSMPLAVEHRVGRDAPSTRLTLADGGELDAAGVGGVVNRLTGLTPHHLALAAPEDQEYALAELYAFALSWLHALPCPVVNPATPLGLGGPAAPPSRWVLQAQRCGLRTRPYRVDDTDPAAARFPDPGGTGLRRRGDVDVLVVGDRVVPGHLPTELHAACVRLARCAGVPLLGLTFRRDADGWCLHDVQVRPDLRVGGDAGVAALADLFPATTGGAP
ncbi:hypothetical protein GC089_09570 [Cellulomonas sp. JZ18]|uniref:hypothetical protein n=1 Tax=Cellulomonas sp. JZ18 TaxID=2654191 RepID=UPI0012D463A8|nr:hypothetical protein [Cellulomonas sp. JZ18]QGQ19432.1 hypothetical protein GC089_09570 [Cellulomonas sp. JZ18]